MSTPEHRDPTAGTGAEGTSPTSPASPEPAQEPTPAPLEPTPISAAPETPVEETRRDRDDRTRSNDAFPVPTGPRTTGFGGHLLGILVGLALTLLATFLVTLGQSRILADGIGRSDVSPETLGIVLVTLGSLIVGLVVLLGLWTPAAPFTGGLLALIVGAAYLFAPAQAYRETVRLIATEQNHTAVVNSISIGTSGGLFMIGIVLLAAATAFSLVRRRGVALGAFRERSQAVPASH